MEEKKAKAKIKNVAQSPQKLRLIADLIRGKVAKEALDILSFTNKKGADIVTKALRSAIANATELHSADETELVISHISIDEAPTYKRFRFASRGRSARIFKRRSHINLELTVK
jgi:large subunit ribosomal protein L22